MFMMMKEIQDCELKVQSYNEERVKRYLQKALVLKLERGRWISTPGLATSLFYIALRVRQTESRAAGLGLVSPPFWAKMTWQP